MPQLIGAIFVLILIWLVVVFVFHITLWLSATIIVASDKVLGAWTLLSPALSWTIVGFLSGTLLYFAVREAPKLSRPAVQPLLIGLVSILVGIVPLLGGLSQKSSSPIVATPKIAPFGPPSTPAPVALPRIPAQPPTLPTGEVGPRTVWKPPDGKWEEIYKSCLLGPSGIDIGCITSGMRNAGASPEAIAFTERMKGERYLRSFYEMGKVDLAEGVAPVLNDPNVIDYLLVNGASNPVQLYDSARNVNLTNDPLYASLRKTFPKLEIWPMHNFDTMQQLSDGEQRFIFNFILMNGCRACEVAGWSKIAFDFNTEGRLVRTMLLGLEPETPIPPPPPPEPWKEGEKHVKNMLAYAVLYGGVGQEAQILEEKRQLEELNVKPPSVRSEKVQELNNRGLMHLDKEQFVNAVQAFEEAYRANSADVEIVNNLGYAHLKNGNLDAAKQFLYQALILSPGRTNAWANLGQTYAKKDSTTDAVACFANAYRFSSSQKKTIEFLQDLTQNDNDIRVKQAANQALQLAFIQGKRESISSKVSEDAPPVVNEPMELIRERRENVPPKVPEGTPPKTNEPTPVSGRYEVVRSTPLLKEPRRGSDIVTWLDSGRKVNVTEASGGYLRVESKSDKEPGYIFREDVKPAQRDREGTAREQPAASEKLLSTLSVPEGGKKIDHFIRDDNGTVLDTRTGLMWMAKDFRTIEGRTPKNWDDAMRWVDKMNRQNYGGYNDWRVPKAVEYQSLIRSISNPGVFEEEARSERWGYWSSDTNTSWPVRDSALAVRPSGEAVGVWKEGSRLSEAGAPMGSGVAKAFNPKLKIGRADSVRLVRFFARR